MQYRYHALTGTALLSLCAMSFCLWASYGVGPEACFTAGCSLYQNFTIASISLWTIGIVAFAILGLLALLGRVRLGARLAMLGVFCDVCLLALMLLTAPCLNCLIVAIFLITIYVGFCRALPDAKSSRRQSRSCSPLVLIWAFFFVCNVGVVIKTQVPLYSLSDNHEEASVHFFFSPSCPACRQGVEKLSGSVDTAFYPVVEQDSDVARIALMRVYLDQGMNMHEALQRALVADVSGQCGFLGCGPVSLRLRLLTNKAHLFMRAGPVVPYVEYRGLPRHLSVAKSPSARRSDPHAAAMDRTADIPIESSIGGYCSADDNCDEGYTPRQ